MLLIYIENRRLLCVKSLVGECPNFDSGDCEIFSGSKHVVVVGLRTLSMAV